MAVQKNNDQLVSLLTPWFIRRRDMMSGARVFDSGATTLTTGVVTTLSFNSELWDTHQYHSTSSNPERLTVNIAGFYHIVGHVRFAANSTGVRFIQIRLDGATPIAHSRINAVSGGATSDMFVSTVYQLSAGQYVELRAQQTSGGDLDVERLSRVSPEFGITRIL